MSNQATIAQAREVLRGRCFGFDRYEGVRVPFSSDILEKFKRSGCLYYVPRGERTLRNGFDTLEFGSSEHVCILVPGGWHVTRLHNKSLVEQMACAGRFAILSVYEIARVWELCGGFSLHGNKARTLDVAGHGMGTLLLSPPKLNFLVRLGRDNLLHFDKEYEGVASSEIGVMLGLRASV